MEKEPKLRFDESYFEGETRDGFYIEPMMKRAWAAQLEVVCDFREFCKKYDISFLADWGTLLGAVRHHGFIPWDDDIDIGMLRGEFEKFISVAKNELSDDAFLQYGAEDINEASWFCRIRKKGTTGIIGGQLYQNCNHGVFIELYPFDEVPNSKIAQYIQIELASLFRQLFGSRYSNIKSTGLLKFL